MRLSDDTADIPEKLIALQEKGEVIFLCGAGISQRYGLPSFYRLTTDIYEHLGESWTGYPAEEEAMGFNPDGTEKEGVAAALDRALFALSKRLRGTDTASRIRAERLFTEAIEKSLKAPAGDFTAHADVWMLSRDPEMRSRIVTTNFDTLFERAASTSVASRACADLPPPLGTDFTGVLHLHGRIADSELGLSRTQLVLNSAEFGEAYLRSGWAARYVYDLARATTIVILGYGADDPPMRYILEVLTADRERYPDIREIFAFVPSPPEASARERISAIWEAKGATAIPYDSTDPKDHDHLYQTIARWAAFAADPTGWRRTEAARILGQDPEAIGEGDWSRLRWLLGGGDAGELLGQINPDPKWAAPLAKAEVFKSVDASPYRWILARLNDRHMPAAVAEDLPLSPHTISVLQRTLSWRDRKSHDLHPVLFQAWQLIVEVATRRLSSQVDFGLRWDRAIVAVNEGDFSLSTKRDIIDCLRPRMGLGRVFQWPGLEEEPREDTLELRHVIRVEWGPGGLGRIAELVAGWPADRRGELIRALMRELEDALEEASETGTLHAASGDVKSVARHSQDAHPDGFYSIVRAVIDLWEAYCDNDGDAAKAQAIEWLASGYLLPRRMGLHALLRPCFSGQEVADRLMALPDDEFWLGDSRRETMQIFVKRWPTVDAKDRARVEQRIVAGLPRDLLRADADPERIAIVRDNAVFIRLARIKEAGIPLSSAGEAALAELRSTHPNWQSEGEQDDFLVWSSGARIVGDQGDISLLTGYAPEKLFDRVEEVVGNDPFAQGDVWRLYCNAEPASALQALMADDPTSEKRPGAWQSFFWSITSSENVPIQQSTIEAISSPDYLFKSAATAEWLLRKRGATTIGTPEFLALWDRIFAAWHDQAGPIDDQSRRDPVFTMLNSPSGKIGSVLLHEYDRVRTDDDPKDQLAILERLERLVGADGELGFLGTAAAMEGLPALFSDHEDWARAHLLPLTEWSSPFATAAWSVLLGANIPQPALYAALKPSLLEAGTHRELERSLDSVAQWLVAPVLWAQAPAGPVPDISAGDVRRALARSAEQVRSHAAFWLGSALEGLQGSSAEIWRNRIGPLLRQIWPIDPSSRSHGASLHLVRLALKTGEAFSDAVDAIIPLIGPLDTWEIESYLGRNEDAKAFYATAPAALLRLLEAVVAENGVPASLLAMLQQLAETDPSLELDPRYLKLLGWARRQAAP